jgi:diguanylate cyclase (GGDEF)-like protein
MTDFCDELRAAIADTVIKYQGGIISVTASIGVCRLEGMDKKAWHKALNAADKALYQAKDKGRNCMVCGES